MTTFAFKPAVREHTPLLIGLAGQSGSGKTFSALELATGLGGKIAFIDTERGRGLHYADRFTFDHAMLTAPFGPERYLDAIVAAEKHVGPGGVVIVDSMSHEWEGVGGLLELAGEIAQKMAQRSGGSPEAYTFPSWREPKMRHQRLANRMLQLQCHLICCFRAKEKLKLVKNAKGRNEPVSMGILPIMEENLPFEMTFLATLHPDQPGVPHWSQKALMEALRPLFRDGQRLDRQLGQRLAAWASSGQPRQERPPEPDAHTGETQDAVPADPADPLGLLKLEWRQGLKELESAIYDDLDNGSLAAAGSLVLRYKEHFMGLGNGAARGMAALEQIVADAVSAKAPEAA